MNLTKARGGLVYGQVTLIVSDRFSYTGEKVGCTKTIKESPGMRIFFFFSFSSFLPSLSIDFFCVLLTRPHTANKSVVLVVIRAYQTRVSCLGIVRTHSESLFKVLMLVVIMGWIEAAAQALSHVDLQWLLSSDKGLLSGMGLRRGRTRVSDCGVIRHSSTQTIVSELRC